MKKNNLLDLKTIECLLRPYEVRTCSLKSPQLLNEANEDENKTEEAEDNKNNHDEHSMNTHNTQNTPTKSPAAKRKRTEPQEAFKDFVNPKAVVEVQGHTGFLTFARKPPKTTN